MVRAFLAAVLMIVALTMGAYGRSLGDVRKKIKVHNACSSSAVEVSVDGDGDNGWFNILPGASETWSRTGFKRYNLEMKRSGNTLGSEHTYLNRDKTSRYECDGRMTCAGGLVVETERVVQKPGTAASMNENNQEAPHPEGISQELRKAVTMNINSQEAAEAFLWPRTLRYPTHVLVVCSSASLFIILWFSLSYRSRRVQALLQEDLDFKVAQVNQERTVLDSLKAESDRRRTELSQKNVLMRLERLERERSQTQQSRLGRDQQSIESWRNGCLSIGPSNDLGTVLSSRITTSTHSGDGLISEFDQMSRNENEEDFGEAADNEG